MQQGECLLKIFVSYDLKEANDFICGSWLKTLHWALEVATTNDDEEELMTWIAVKIDNVR